MSTSRSMATRSVPFSIASSHCMHLLRPVEARSANGYGRSPATGFTFAFASSASRAGRSGTLPVNATSASRTSAGFFPAAHVR